MANYSRASHLASDAVPGYHRIMTGISLVIFAQAVIGLYLGIAAGLRVGSWLVSRR